MINGFHAKIRAALRQFDVLATFLEPGLKQHLRSPSGHGINHAIEPGRCTEDPLSQPEARRRAGDEVDAHGKSGNGGREVWISWRNDELLSCRSRRLWLSRI